MENLSPKISVVVPIYNKEKYLHRCINSILSQTFTDFELLLIDDGSTDNSGIICDKYAQENKCVRVFHKKNGGVSSARNMGLDKSKGEWITFVDSDDWIKPDYLKNFLLNDAQLIVCAHETNEVSSEMIINDMLFDRVAWTTWGKLYKTEVLKKCNPFSLPRDLNIGEDLISNIIYCNNINKVKYVENDGYYYCVNNDSLTKTRKWSIDYETKFLSYVKSILGDNKTYSAGYWLLTLRAIKNLYSNGVIVPHSCIMYKNVKAHVYDVPLGLGDKLVLLCPFARLTMYLLNVLKKH